jgi:hypothetical protein
MGLDYRNLSFLSTHVARTGHSDFPGDFLSLPMASLETTINIERKTPWGLAALGSQAFRVMLKFFFVLFLLCFVAHLAFYDRYCH